jgi:hypothetical protein
MASCMSAVSLQSSIWSPTGSGMLSNMIWSFCCFIDIFYIASKSIQIVTSCTVSIYLMPLSTWVILRLETMQWWTRQRPGDFKFLSPSSPPSWWERVVVHYDHSSCVDTRSEFQRPPDLDALIGCWFYIVIPSLCQNSPKFCMSSSSCHM